MDTGGSLRPVLRLLFNSDFFKEARYARVKSPAELVAGTIKLAGTHRFPDPGLVQLGEAPEYMGQHLTNPPTVEGWHTGREWIDGGALTERVNFAADELGDVTKPGVREMIERLSGDGSAISPGGTRGPEPGPGRAGRGQRRHPGQPAGPLPVDRRPDVRD